MSNKPLSKSHLELGNLCLRRERFVYGAGGEREPQTVAAEAGNRVHDLLEEYLRDGKPIPVSAEWNGYPIGQLAQNMTAHLPEAGSVQQAEVTFTATIDGIDFTGIVDWEKDGTVGDHKTTSKPRGIKSKASLSEDIQRLLYVAAREPERTQWTYGVWSTQETKAVLIPVEKKKDRERFKLRVLPIAEKILSLSDDIDPLSLPGNPDACRLYPPQGCPFKDRCGEVKHEMNDAFSKIGTAIVTETEPEPVSAHLIETLFIDCLPLYKANLTYAHTLLAKACQSVADDMHVHHPLLIDFAKGAPMIAAQLVDDIKKSGPIEKLFLETKSSEGRAVMESLMGVSKYVVKGFI